MITSWRLWLLEQKGLPKQLLVASAQRCSDNRGSTWQSDDSIADLVKVVKASKQGVTPTRQEAIHHLPIILSSKFPLHSKTVLSPVSHHIKINQCSREFSSSEIWACCATILLLTWLACLDAIYDLAKRRMSNSCAQPSCISCKRRSQSSQI